MAVTEQRPTAMHELQLANACGNIEPNISGKMKN
jgi:hypothetical protein